jgi:Flp pilus assembly protein TadG
VEFALTVPLLLLLLLGTADIGIGFKTYIGLTNATREGARYISIHSTDEAGAKARISEEAGRIGLAEGALDQGGYQPTFTFAGGTVTVAVAYHYKLLFGAIPGLVEIPFTATSTMVVLYTDF